MSAPLPARRTFLAVLALGCSDAGVTKFNTDPTAEISSHLDGDTVREGYVETLRGVVGDANHGFDQLAVTWLVEGVSVCPESSPDDEGVVSCEHTFVPSGEAVVLEVRDPEGGSASARVTVDVQPTDAPLAEIGSPTSSGIYYSDQLTTLEGWVSDLEDGPADLSVVWSSSLDGVLAGGFDVPDSEGALLGAVTFREGEHFVTLEVSDATGKQGRDSVTIQVGPPNSTPTCAIVAPADGAAGAEGEAVRFEATVGDVDVPADWLAVEWSSDKDGVLGNSTPTSSGDVVLTSSALSVNTHTITLRATDEVGATCSDLVVYTVGTPPVLVVTSPTSGDTANEGASVAFAATVSDGEDLATALSMSWASDVDGVLSTDGPDSTGAVSFSAASLSTGPHQVTVRVTDTDGLYAQQTLDLLVNALPTAPTVSLLPDPATTSETLSATASGSTDPDGSGSVTYRYDWFEDGVASSASTRATFPSASTTKGSTYRVVVTPSDGTGDGPSGQAEVRVVNSDPVLTGPTLSASTAQVGDTLTCSASATDADAADSPVITYTWQDGSTGSTYTVPDSDDPGATLTCTATADDQDGGTDAGTASATVTNTAPVLGAVTVTPSSGRVGDTLTCAATATDADGGTPTVTYAWPDGSTGNTYTIVSTDDPGDSIACTATATDADGGTDSATGSATVTNTDPVLGTVGILPATATNDDTLTCAATATDADGGSPTVTYAWTGSAAGSLGSASTLDLSTTGVASTETVTCTATATDTDGGTATGSAALITANRDPSVAVTLSPSSGATRGDTLTCAASSADADGDAISTSFAWTVGGATVAATSTGSASSTLSGAFVAGETVTCTATSTDGKGGSGSAAASTTITNHAPVVGTVSLSPATVYTNDTLTASASTSDADGDTLSVTFDWYVGGALVQSGATATLDGATSFDKDDVVYAVVSADDGIDTTSSTSASVTIANTAPTAPTVAIDPTEPVSGDSLVCEVATASDDADGDGITYSVAWTVDGVDYAAGGSTDTGGPDSGDPGWAGPSTTTWTDDTVDGSDVENGQVWTCTIVANDGELDGPSASATATIDAPDGCVDGSVEGDASLWGRSDIAYCEFPFDYNSVLLAEAASHCASQWHVCTSAEFTARNDDFSNVDSRVITGRIDDGENCFAHDNGQTSSGHFDFSSDGVRSSFAGTCSGTTSDTNWGRQERIEDGLCADDLECGVVCCPD